MSTDNKSPLTVAVTGASGAPYALALLRELARLGQSVELVASDMGRDMLRRETDVPSEGALLPHLDGKGIGTSRFREYANDCLGAPPASGSHRTLGMVVCPCSVKTLSAVAVGACRSLIERAAEVCLKERRPLVLVLRETPYSLTVIESMRAVTLAGAVVLPASPAFYHNPQKIEDLVDFVAARVLDRFGLEHGLLRPWDGGQ
ncbi:UbiX family flavin prenyltransferase [bacterium]|nr:UbiX family flavin prenyltransferase [bacterium]